MSYQEIQHYPSTGRQTGLCKWLPHPFLMVLFYSTHIHSITVELVHQKSPDVPCCTHSTQCGKNTDQSFKWTTRKLVRQKHFPLEGIDEPSLSGRVRQWLLGRACQQRVTHHFKTDSTYTEYSIQCLRRVFRPRDFTHYSLILKWIKSTHNTL